MLNLDEVLKPLQTSYTQSGKVGDTPASAKGETTTTTITDTNKQDNQTQQNDDQTNNTTSQNTNNDGD